MKRIIASALLVSMAGFGLPATASAEFFLGSSNHEVIREVRTADEMGRPSHDWAVQAGKVEEARDRQGRDSLGPLSYDPNFDTPYQHRNPLNQQSLENIVSYLANQLGVAVTVEDIAKIDIASLPQDKTAQFFVGNAVDLLAQVTLKDGTRYLGILGGSTMDLDENYRINYGVSFLSPVVVFIDTTINHTAVSDAVGGELTDFQFVYLPTMTEAREILFVAVTSEGLSLGVATVTLLLPPVFMSGQDELELEEENQHYPIGPYVGVLNVDAVDHVARAIVGYEPRDEGHFVGPIDLEVLAEHLGIDVSQIDADSVEYVARPYPEFITWVYPPRPRPATYLVTFNTVDGTNYIGVVAIRKLWRRWGPWPFEPAGRGRLVQRVRFLQESSVVGDGAILTNTGLIAEHLGLADDEIQQIRFVSGPMRRAGRWHVVVVTDHGTYAGELRVVPVGMTRSIPPTIFYEIRGIRYLRPVMIQPIPLPDPPIVYTEPPIEKEPGPDPFGPPEDFPHPIPIDPPVIEPPVIEPPVIEPPVIEPPVIEPPVIEPPVIEPPVIEPSVIDHPEYIEPPVRDPDYINPPSEGHPYGDDNPPLIPEDKDPNEGIPYGDDIGKLIPLDKDPNEGIPYGDDIGKLIPLDPDNGPKIPWPIPGREPIVDRIPDVDSDGELRLPHSRYPDLPSYYGFGLYHCLWLIDSDKHTT